MVYFGLGPFFRKSPKKILHRFIIKINQNQLYKNFNNFSTAGLIFDLIVSLDRVHKDLNLFLLG